MTGNARGESWKRQEGNGVQMQVEAFPEQEEKR